MNLEDILLSRVSQSRKDKWCPVPLREVRRGVKFIGACSRRVGARSWGREEWELSGGFETKMVHVMV